MVVVVVVVVVGGWMVECVSKVTLISMIDGSILELFGGYHVFRSEVWTEFGI